MMLFFGVVVTVLLVLTLARIDNMKQSLTDAINALNAEVADTQGKLDSIKTFILGVPALAAAAVSDALAANDVEEEAAAASVEAARQAVSDRVDDTLAAINANPGPGDETPPV